VYGKDYFNRLSEVGFKVKEIDYTKKLPKEKIKRYALTEGEILPVCVK
jgi:hypothetical protein